MGWPFDFNQDGKLGFEDAGRNLLYASEWVKASKKAEREKNRSKHSGSLYGDSWDDDDDDLDYDDDDDAWDDDDDLDELDDDESYVPNLRNAEEITEAVNYGDYWGDVDRLIEKAVNKGTRFTPDQVILLSEDLTDQGLLARLIATSSPAFTDYDASRIDPKWGGVQIERHEEAWKQESWGNNTYRLNTPEEDWVEEKKDQPNPKDATSGPGAPELKAGSSLAGSFYVAGFKHHEGPQVIRFLKPGAELELVPEPDNPFDRDAIGVHFCSRMLGYVPAKENGLLASLLRQGFGEFVQARVSTVDPTAGEREKIRVDIYLAPWKSHGDA